MNLLRCEGVRLIFLGQKRPSRFAIDPGSRDGHEFPLRPAKGGQLPAEDAAGVDVRRAIEPLWFRDGRMSVHYDCPPSVFGRPVVPHRKAKLIGFAGRFAIEGKFPYLTRATPLHFSLHPGVSDDEFAVVENIVANEAVNEFGRRLCEAFPDAFGQRLHFGDGLGQTMLDLHLPALEFAQELHVVIARHAKGDSHRPLCCEPAAGCR